MVKRQHQLERQKDLIKMHNLQQGDFRGNWSWIVQLQRCSWVFQNTKMYK